MRLATIGIRIHDGDVKLLSLSSIEAYSAIIIGIVVYVFGTNWLVMIASLAVMIGLIADLAIRGPWAMRTRLSLRVTAAAAAAAITISLFWTPIAAAYRAGHSGTSGAVPPTTRATTTMGNVNAGCVVSGGQVTTNNCTYEPQVFQKNTTINKTLEDLLLIPAHDPSSKNTCPIPRGAITVEMGTNTAFWIGESFTVISFGDFHLMDVKKSQGHIIISLLRIFDDKNNIILRYGGLRPWKSPEVRIERPDKSTIQVFDHNDREVLNLRFKNSSTLSIRGVFRKPDSPPVYIDDAGMHVGHGIEINGTCIGSKNTFIFGG